MSEALGKILLVDDYYDQVDRYQRVLEKIGFIVSIARNGTEALELLENDEEIIALRLDNQMPRPGGYEVLNQLLENRKDVLERLQFIVFKSSAVGKMMYETGNALLQQIPDYPLYIISEFDEQTFWRMFAEDTCESCRYSSQELD